MADSTSVTSVSVDEGSVLGRIVKEKRFWECPRVLSLAKEYMVTWFSAESMPVDECQTIKRILSDAIQDLEMTEEWFHNWMIKNHGYSVAQVIIFGHYGCFFRFNKMHRELGKVSFEDEEVLMKYAI